MILEYLFSIMLYYSEKGLKIPHRIPIKQRNNAKTRRKESLKGEKIKRTLKLWRTATAYNRQPEK